MYTVYEAVAFQNQYIYTFISTSEMGNPHKSSSCVHTDKKSQHGGITVIFAFFLSTFYQHTGQMPLSLSFPHYYEWQWESITNQSRGSQKKKAITY